MPGDHTKPSAKKQYNDIKDSHFDNNAKEKWKLSDGIVGIRPGDIVFYKTTGLDHNKVFHVSIYIGNNTMIDSTFVKNDNGQVEINGVSPRSLDTPVTQDGVAGYIVGYASPPGTYN